jgi:hypothetical protein
VTTRLQIRLDRDEADALARLAASELRDPRDQIRLMVRRELKQGGWLPANTPTETQEPHRD